MRMVFMVFIICKKLKRQCAVFVFGMKPLKLFTVHMIFGPRKSHVV